MEITWKLKKRSKLFAQELNMIRIPNWYTIFYNNMKFKYMDQR